MSPAAARRYAESLAAERGLTFDDLTGPKRRAPLPEIRRLVWHRLKEAGWSVSRIGTFANRHRTSVLHGLEQLEKAA